MRYLSFSSPSNIVQIVSRSTLDVFLKWKASRWFPVALFFGEYWLLPNEPSTWVWSFGLSAKNVSPSRVNQIGLRSANSSLFIFLFVFLSALLCSLSLYFSLPCVFADINNAIQNYQGTSANGTAKVVSKKRPAISARYKNIRRKRRERLVDDDRSSRYDGSERDKRADNIRIAVSQLISIIII